MQDGQEKTQTDDAALPARDQPKDHGNVYQGGSHRAFVGGLWEEIGQLQFDFLRKQGLLPQHVLLDVGCGALRGGVHFISYLDAENYLGIEAEAELLQRAIAEELSPALLERKKPQLRGSRLFDFEHFSKTPDFAIAQSVFTHLNGHDISRCLRKLGKFCKPETKFFVSFFEVDTPRKNPDLSHAQQYFAYTADEMRAFGELDGFAGTYIGDWAHGRGQKMFLYTPKA